MSLITTSIPGRLATSWLASQDLARQLPQTTTFTSVLVDWLEQSFPSEKLAGLRADLENNPNASLGRLFTHLPLRQQQSLRKQLGEEPLESLFRLGVETHREMFARAFVDLAYELQRSGQPRAAQAALQWVLKSTVSERLKSSAQNVLRKLRGEDLSFTEQMGQVLESLPQALSPGMVASFAAGQLVYLPVRFGILNGLWKAGATRSALGVVGSRAAAAVGASLLEIPAVLGSSYALEGGSLSDLRAAASLGLGMAMLRFGHWGTSTLLQQRAVTNVLRKRAWLQATAPTLASTFSGVGALYEAHRIEEQLGWVPQENASRRWIKVLGTSLHLALGGRAAQTLLGPRWMAYHRHMEQSLSIQLKLPRVSFPKSPWWNNSQAFAMEGRGYWQKNEGRYGQARDLSIRMDGSLPDLTKRPDPEIWNTMYGEKLRRILDAENREALLELRGEIIATYERLVAEISDKSKVPTKLRKLAEARGLQDLGAKIKNGLPHRIKISLEMLFDKHPEFIQYLFEYESFQELLVRLDPQHRVEEPPFRVVNRSQFPDDFPTITDLTRHLADKPRFAQFSAMMPYYHRGSRGANGQNRLGPYGSYLIFDRRGITLAGGEKILVGNLPNYSRCEPIGLMIGFDRQGSLASHLYFVDPMDLGVINNLALYLEMGNPLLDVFANREAIGNAEPVNGIIMERLGLPTELGKHKASSISATYAALDAEPNIWGVRKTIKGRWTTLFARNTLTSGAQAFAVNRGRLGYFIKVSPDGWVREPVVARSKFKTKQAAEVALKEWVESSGSHS